MKCEAVVFFLLHSEMWFVYELMGGGAVRRPKESEYAGNGQN